MQTEQQQFVFFGHNVAIDFVNTQAADRGEKVELLKSSEDLAKWAKAAELPLDSSDINQHSFKKALALRGALREVFGAVLDTRSVPLSELNMINQHLLDHKTEQELKSVRGKIELRHTHTTLSIKRLFGRIANEAALLLASKRLEKVKRCANPKCVLLFVDTSKSGKRRWCSMAVCGNRSKVASHYISTKEH